MPEINYKYSREQIVFYVKMVNHPYPPTICNDCDGRGKLQTKVRDVKCPFCNGKGKINNGGGSIKNEVFSGRVKYVTIVINNEETSINYMLYDCDASIRESQLYETQEDAEKTINHNCYMGYTN